MGSTPVMLDQHFMYIALSLAKRHVGITAPNPSVGCVVVKDGVIVGRAVTARGGRPHAETQALAQAGKKAKGATAYVTLEPCSHHGKTPPCTDAIIKAGVARVVIACHDSDPRMQGKSLKILKQAGIKISTGILEKEARKINEGFFSVVEKSRPFVTLKLATSRDGKIASSAGSSTWITNAESRAYAHLLRAQHDAILVGIGTVMIDNPLLTCRLPGLEDRSPIRIVVDTHGRLSAKSQLVKTARTIPVWQLTGENISNLPGVKSFVVSTHSGRISLTHALKTLAQHGVTRLLVEGGSKIATSLLKENLVDSVVHIQAEKIIGSSGVDALIGFDIKNVGKDFGFKTINSRTLGSDRVFTSARD